MIWLYVIQQDGAGLLKIGVTGNLRRRINSLQTGNANRLTLLCAVKFRDKGAAYGAESVVHARLKQYRAVGEWFKVKLGDVVPLLMCEVLANGETTIYWPDKGVRLAHVRRVQHKLLKP